MTGRERVRALLIARLPLGWSVDVWISDRLVCTGPDEAVLVITDAPTESGRWKGWDLIVSDSLCGYGGALGYWRQWPEDIVYGALAAVARR